MIGLGNPGKKYAKNRHNVGEMFVRWLKEEEKRRRGGDGEMKRRRGEDRERWSLVTLKSFMNDSGKAVSILNTKYKIPNTNLIIVHDDLDLRFGEYKLQFGKGPYGHNGILSIEDELGTKDFWRLRIGIDNRDPENRTLGVAYTLQDFTPEEFKGLKDIFLRMQRDLDVTFQAPLQPRLDQRR